MKYLVLGGGGFIGTNLVKYLLASSEYNEVIAVDNNLTGNLARLQEVVVYPGLNRLQTVEGNICDNSTYEELPKVDVIYNLACPASPIQYQANPIPTIQACTVGMLKSLQFAEWSEARYFQASTSEIYGNPDNHHHPQNESYHGNVNTWGPRACYDEGKRLAETICYEYSDIVNIRIARIFNTYGPYMQRNDGRVISNFIISALNNEPITIYGDGKQSRSFCYIDDLIQGFMALGTSNFETPTNVGNPLEFSIEELAKIIILLTDSKSELIFKSLPKDDPERRQPDIRKISTTGWKPVTTLMAGLDKTINYFRGNVL